MSPEHTLDIARRWEGRLRKCSCGWLGATDVDEARHLAQPDREVFMVPLPQPRARCAGCSNVLYGTGRYCSRCSFTTGRRAA